MRVIRRALPHLMGKGKGLWQKVKFAKQTAFYNQSAVQSSSWIRKEKHAERIKELIKGRDDGYAEFPIGRWGCSSLHRSLAPGGCFGDHSGIEASDRRGCSPGA